MRRLSGRAARLRAGRFLAEGPQAVREAVTSQLVETVYATAESLLHHRDIAEAMQAARLRPQVVSAEVLTAMSDTVTPQGLLAVCRLLASDPANRLPAVLAARPRLLAVLARVRDPGNAGAVIRAADAAGADAVVVTEDSVDVHNPKCVRATAGSLFHLPVVAGLPLADVVTSVRAAGLGVLAADGAGPTDLDDLQDDASAGRGPLAGRVAWVFGNEAWGLPEADAALADDVVRVPVHGRAESLNLATAATLCLYATARAHRSPRPHPRPGPGVETAGPPSPG